MRRGGFPLPCRPHSSLQVDEALNSKATTIFLLQDNPKKANTKSWKRYEGYKAATTVRCAEGLPSLALHDFTRFLVAALRFGIVFFPLQVGEYLSLGGLKADIKFDYQRSYLAVRRPDGSKQWANGDGDGVAIDATDPAAPSDPVTPGCLPLGDDKPGGDIGDGGGDGGGDDGGDGRKDSGGDGSGGGGDGGEPS